MVLWTMVHGIFSADVTLVVVAVQGVEFKAEGSTSFKILVKLQVGFAWQRARNT